MVSEERETEPRAGRVCPTCHQPLPTRIKRHKTLGVYVPRWVTGPCENPDCGRQPG